MSHRRRVWLRWLVVIFSIDVAVFGRVGCSRCRRCCRHNLHIVWLMFRTIGWRRCCRWQKSTCHPSTTFITTSFCTYCDAGWRGRPCSRRVSCRRRDDVWSTFYVTHRETSFRLLYLLWLFLFTVSHCQGHGHGRCLYKYCAVQYQQCNTSTSPAGIWSNGGIVRSLKGRTGQIPDCGRFLTVRRQFSFFAKNLENILEIGLHDFLFGKKGFVFGLQLRHISQSLLAYQFFGSSPSSSIDLALCRRTSSRSRTVSTNQVHFCTTRLEARPLALSSIQRVGTVLQFKACSNVLHCTVL